MMDSPIRYRLAGGRLVASVFAGLALAACSVAGCGTHGSPSDTIESSGSPEAAFNGGDTVATVNSDKVTSAEFYDALQHYVPSRIPGFPQNPLLAQPAGRVALQNLIVNSLTVQLARDNGVPVTQAELDASYNDTKMLQEAQITAPFESILEQQGYTRQQYESEVLAPSVARDNLLSKTVALTPQELQSGYQANLNLYTIPTSVHIHRIACASQQQARNIYNGIKSGAPMSQFAPNSIASDDAGGNPDDVTDVASWINVDQPSPGLGAVSEMLKSAKTGDVIAPVQIQGQWWVMQIVGYRPRQVIPFSQVADLVRINLVHQKAGEQGQGQFQGALMQYMRKASIKIAPLQYQSLAAQIHDAGMPEQSAPTQAAPAAGKAP
jgi:parvulin-like peptidyl-prolyl isomerase